MQLQLSVVVVITGLIRGFNYAQDMTTRSPGSVIKPLLDYGPAIEFLDWSTAQTTVDEKMTYTGTDQVIRNWDVRYVGSMTMREALYRSRNVPAVKTLQRGRSRQCQRIYESF